jgi:hypothetical protein
VEEKYVLLDKDGNINLLSLGRERYSPIFVMVEEEGEGKKISKSGLFVIAKF